MPIKDPSLADLVRFFFSENEQEHRALTLSRMEHITDNIADGKFVASTPAADAIYGREMDGSVPVWISTTQPLDTFLQGRKMWAARQVDPTIPTEYLTDILQPSGEVVSVLKSTQELDIDGVRYWFTVVTPASDKPRIRHIRDIPVTVDGLPAIGMSGKMCIAEVLHQLELTKNSLTDQTDPGKLGSNMAKMDLTGADMDSGANTREISLVPSSTGQVQRPHYVHTCSECHGSWVGTSINPPKCTYCGSRLWRGYSKWQERKRN